MNSRIRLLTAAVVAASLLPGLALAQKKVPGEKWKTSISMQAAGMTMPARTQEICAPVGKADEAMARPQGNDNCSVHDVQRSGNKFSAKISCTGSNAMEGTMEQVTDGNHMVGMMRMKIGPTEMAMKYDSTKLGTACEAIDYSDYKPPAMPSMPAVNMPAPVDVCKMMADNLTKDPSSINSSINMYLGANAQCGKASQPFCKALQTPAGYQALAKQERDMAAARAGAKAADKDMAAYAPLSSALPACGLGKDPAALRTRMLAAAEASGNWDFLMQEGNDATRATLAATATRECSGRSYTSAANSKYAALCRQYGMGLIRGGRN